MGIGCPRNLPKQPTPDIHPYRCKPKKAEKRLLSFRCDKDARDVKCSDNTNRKKKEKRAKKKKKTMGRKRNSAKTGDKALYANRSKQVSSSRSPVALEDDDNENDHGDVVGRFHRRRGEEFISLHQGEYNGEDDGGGLSLHHESVMDLGAGSDSSSDGNEDDDDDEDGESMDNGDNAAQHQSNPQDDQMEMDITEESVSSDDSDDDDGEVKDSVLDPQNWGRKKATYYHGDTADLEIGQDENVSDVFATFLCNYPMFPPSFCTYTEY